MDKLFIFLQRIVPHHALSRMVGLFAETKVPWLKKLLINMFIKVYRVELKESARKSVADFENFNDFFTRELAQEARTITGNITSPADGTISTVGKIDRNQIFQAKGLNYSLEKLLGTTNFTDFTNGSFITIYLAPNNYHRVHFPTDGSLKSSRYIPGKLFSVNQVTANYIPDLLADNERLICEVITDKGRLAVIMVGAMIVAGIKTTWRTVPYPFGKFHSETFDNPLQYQKGDELGQFRLGSTVILLFPGDIDWQVQPGDTIRFGDPLA